MSVVISSSLVIGDTVSGGGVINANNPIIGYETLVTTGNVSATTEAAGFPATNVANPSTNLRWLGEISSPEQDEYFTLDIQATDDVDYIGIARHNFHSAQIAVSIEGLSDPDASPLIWDELVSPVIPPDDGPLLFRFTASPYASLRIRMQPGSAAPYAAVVYAGKLLVLQRRIYVGHQPITYARKAKVTNARSEAGDFLGRIVLNEMTATSVDLRNLTPSWYRTYLQPFIAASKQDPFFFAWRPSDYPNEVGYAWMTNDPMPRNDLPNGMMSIDLEMGGIYQ